MKVEIGTKAAQFLFLGMHKWDFHCSAVTPINAQSNPALVPCPLLLGYCNSHLQRNTTIPEHGMSTIATP
jgi:hypothetical protein